MNELPPPYAYIPEQYSTPAETQSAFLDHMEVKYRALMMEIRDVEKHLLRGGRISHSQLRPVRER